MIRVLIGTNTNRKTVVIDPSKTIKEVLEENGVDYSTGGIHLDGESIGGAELNRTFAEKGINSDCMLISVVNAKGGIL